MKSRARLISSALLSSVLLITALSLTQNAFAAPKSSASKSVLMKKLDLLAAAPGAEGLLISGKTLITFVNTGGSNSNILLTGLDVNGTQVWQKTIDSGADEIALAGAVDSAGNIWLAGDAAPLATTDTTTVVLPPDNPDGVVVEALSKLRSDMSLLTLWKLSPTGDLLATYSQAQQMPVLINGISVNASGVSLVGQMADSSFAISATSTGAFGKLINIGSAKTQLNAVVRNPDGTLSVFGSSSEKLGGKKNVGIRDGILVKISKSGVITSVVRSSAPKAERSWNYSDSSLTLTGSVKTGKKFESAFTKFTAAFAPTWTLRIPSGGNSLVATGGAFTYAALDSNSAIPGVTGWKPTVTQLVILSLDSKGLITGAFAATELATPTALSYSKEIGLYGLARASDGATAIFHLATK
jgi:hypothetical protein